MKSYIMNSQVHRILCMLLMLVLVLSTAILPSHTALASVHEYIAYEHQLELLTILGVYEHIDADTLPESTVTRAQFAEVVANLSHYNGVVSNDLPYYTDVSADHEYFSHIQYVTRNFMMNGVGNYLFAPDQNVSQIQALTVMLKILGYGDIAEVNGGYPAGYISLGSKTKLVRGSVGTGTEAITVGQLTELIYNALCADVVESLPAGDSLDYNTNTGKTLLYDRFSVIVHVGLITASEQTSLWSPEGEGRGYMSVDGVRYRTAYDANSHIGTNAICFIKEGKPGTVIFIAEDAQTKILQIDAQNIDGYKDFIYSYTENDKDETAKLSLNIKVIYNGRYTPFNELSVNDYIPEVGSIKLIDLDDDKLYDVLSIINYEYYVISSVNTTNNMIYDKYNRAPLNMDIADEDRFVSYSSMGMAIELSYFKTDDCLEVLASRDGAIVSAERVTDKCEGMVNEIGNGKICIDGEEYEILEELLYVLRDSSGAVVRQAVELGVNARFHISDSGVVVHFEKISNISDAYGYMIGYTKSGCAFSSSLMFKILSENDPIVYEAADRVVFVGSNPNDYSKVTLTPEQLYDALEKDFSLYPKRTAGNRDVVRFSINSEGKLSKLELSKDKASTDKEEKYAGYTMEAFTQDFHRDSMRFLSQRVGTKYIPDADTVVFTVPNSADADDMYYRRGTKADLGSDSTRKITVYGSDENYIPAVIVLYTSASTGTVQTESSGDAWRKPILLVESVSRAIMNDGEEGYKLTGYESGTLTSRYASDDVLSFADNTWEYAHLTIHDIAPGDVIQYVTDRYGNIADILILKRASVGKYVEHICTESKNGTNQLNADNAIDILHTLYGEVVRKSSQSITVNGNKNLDWEWNRTYHIQSPYVMIFDTATQKITLSAFGDIRPGDKVFVRVYDYNVREIVIYR